MSQPNKPFVIFLMGPTASGKTDLAMQLYEEFNCRLISVDSALVYKGLDIGTAKPSVAELHRYPHELINIREPDQPYSASAFRDDALRHIELAFEAGQIPVLVGGTMLYFKTLMQGIADLPSADEALRKEIDEQADKVGWPAMHAELATFDSASATRIKPNDSQRLQRAIEVYRLTGKTLTEYFAEQQESAFQYPVLNLAVSPPDRAILRERIKQRLHNMFEDGFIDEVKSLLENNGYSRDLPALRSVGYRQIVDYLYGDCDEHTMHEKAVTATARLAKRQMTWLRSWPKVVWLKSDNKNNMSIIKEQMATYF